MILPDMLLNAPMFKYMGGRGGREKGGPRGKSAILRAGAGGRGLCRGRPESGEFSEGRGGWVEWGETGVAGEDL